MSCVPSCLATCQTPEPVCAPSSSCVPGCGCPGSTVYDQTQQKCVSPSSCGKYIMSESEIDDCCISQLLVYVEYIFCLQILVVFLIILVLVVVHSLVGFSILPLVVVNYSLMADVVGIITGSLVYSSV